MTITAGVFPTGSLRLLTSVNERFKLVVGSHRLIWLGCRDWCIPVQTTVSFNPWGQRSPSASSVYTLDLKSMFCISELLKS